MSGRYLRQSTASQSRSLGPFVDDTDFKTAETGLTIANTDIKLMANGAASADKNSGGGTHRVNGHYGVTFDATDTATVGELTASVVVAGALPVFGYFCVLEEAVYDELFGASALGYIANAPVTLADAVAHGGTLGSSTATLALSRLNVTSQTSNTAGLTVAGNGSGAGISTTGGATGAGFKVIGGGTSGNGVDITTTSGHAISSVATGTGKHGINAVGGNNGDGLKANGTGTGHGIEAVSGTGASGDGINASAASTDGRGLIVTGAGTGSGLYAVGSGTGDGIKAIGGGLSINGTITTVTNLTNAPTNGDLTAAMKTSVTTAATAATPTAAAVTGAVGSVTGLTASDVGAIKTQTDKFVFTVANEVNANARYISGSSTAGTNLKSGALGLVPGTCAAGSTTTSIVTNLTEATDDHYNGAVITFTTGALLGQRTSISDYNGTTKTLTVVALTEAPADTDGFVIS